MTTPQEARAMALALIKLNTRSEDFSTTALALASAVVDLLERQAQPVAGVIAVREPLKASPDGWVEIGGTSYRESVVRAVEKAHGIK